jgi:nicotinamide riboside kinase
MPMQTEDFLRLVVTSPEGHFLLATRGEAGWQEHWYDWPQQIAAITPDAMEYAGQQHDVYFSAHLFAERRSLKSLVLPTRTIQADLDYADIMALPVIPTVVVGTSPSRHQGYWVLSETQEAAQIEALSRRIAYGTRDCDRTGWPAGHRMRLPGTHNFKYMTPASVEIVGHTLKSLDIEAFNLFPSLVTATAQAEADVEWIGQGHAHVDVGPIQLMHDAKLSPKVITQYDKVAKDRSAALWALMMDAFRHGLERDQVYWLAWNSANNKFRDDHRYAAVADLRKDVLRAESVALDRTLDLKAAIMDLRQLRGIGSVGRMLKMSSIVLARMREDGELIHTRGGQLWFMRKDTGRPVEIGERSLWLDAYLQRTFAMNPTEQAARFVKHELVNHTRNQAATSDLTTLAYYEPMSRVVLVHTGGRDVLHVSANNIEVHPNGYAHTVFTVDDSTEPFKLGRAGDLGGTRWYDRLFGSQMDHIEGILTKQEAVCLLRAWFLLLFFRNEIANRPLLTVLGAPGSGKTTTAKKLYRLLYGRFKHITTIESEERFNTATVNAAFVAFDGIDSYERWLPEKLSQAAAVTDVQSRRLYTDTDVITQRRQALLMLTAHNPKFTREDVVDRMIIVLLKRRPHWLPESSILEEVSCLRNALWADIVRDLQAILATPMPNGDSIPQFRIEDYAQYGMWFSQAVGLGDVFAAAVAKLVTSQRGLNLETDQLLVSVITRWLRARREKGHEPEYMQQSSMWNELCLYAADPSTFQRVYHNALFLGRKLLTMQDSLKIIFDVDVRYDPATGARQWKIGEKRIDQT